MNGHATDVTVGTRLFDVIEAQQVPLSSACGGRGNCHLCRVQITSGLSHLSPPTLLEKTVLGNVSLAEGWRLACQTEVHGEVAVTVPTPRRKQRPLAKPMPR